MQCLFCGFEAGVGGTVDPCEAVLTFEDHLLDHVNEMVLAAYLPDAGLGS